MPAVRARLIDAYVNVNCRKYSVKSPPTVTPDGLRLDCSALINARILCRTCKNVNVNRQLTCGIRPMGGVTHIAITNSGDQSSAKRRRPVRYTPKQLLTRRKPWLT